MTDLSPVPSASQDVVFSAFALGYVDDLPACFGEVYRVLKKGGLFVWSQGHPFFDWYAAERSRPEAEQRSYTTVG
jgi:ubiquinone/menaquinone biosynthesis C-methylase UbiE